MKCLFPILVLLCLTAARSPAQTTAPRDTFPRVVHAPPVEVSTTRSHARAPVAASRLGRAAIEQLNHGQDTPMALAALPSTYAYSDAGNGIGYSYLSIRGFPQRRISVLVDGVPLNDPQSHEVYWIDHPDLLASGAEVQVIRGVGPALYGAAALGGTVTIETTPFTESSHASALVGGGSFGTRRLMLESGSGALRGGWNLYGRYSRIETDGYRDQSWSRLWSYALGAQRVWGSQAVRLQLKGGPEETHLAYLGVPAAYLEGRISGDAERDRRFNPISFEGEQDRFFEPHYTLTHSWGPSEAVTLSQTLFWFDGRGHYDEQRFGRALADYRLPSWTTADSTLLPRDYYAQDGTGALNQDGQGRFTVERFDLVRRREVINRQFGWLPRVRMPLAGGALTVGGELRAQDGRHVGRLLSAGAVPAGFTPGQRYYDYHPRVLAAGLFARHEYALTPALHLTGDLAWRHAGYRMRGDAFDGVAFDQTYDFGLPRLGLSWAARPDLQFTAGWSRAAREPAFRDLYDAEGVGSRPLYRVVDVANGIYADPLIKPERVQAWELGGIWRREGVSFEANAFRMDFRDELVYAGQFDTDLGYPILGNAAGSIHQGVELAGTLEQRAGGVTWTIESNATLSDHHFVRYRERYGPTPADEASYDGNAIGFFPALSAHAALRGSRGGVTFAAAAHHVGRIFVDNSESRAHSIDPRTTLDLMAAVARPVGGARMEARLRVINALDARYATSGYLDYDATGALVPHLVPAATRSALAELRLSW